jgi:hypothetical protein
MAMTPDAPAQVQPAPGLVLASVAVVFFIGFVAKMVLLLAPRTDHDHAEFLLRLRDNRRMVGKLAVVAVGMFAFGYALVPMYRASARPLGINILSLSEQQVWAMAGGAACAAQRQGNTQVDTSRTITVEFDANARGPWDFKPAQRSLQVHPGELTTVMYEFRTCRTAPWRRRPFPATRRAGSGALQQAGVLLLQRVHAGAGRKKSSGRWPSSSTPSCPRT